MENTLHPACVATSHDAACDPVSKLRNAIRIHSQVQDSQSYHVDNGRTTNFSGNMLNVYMATLITWHYKYVARAGLSARAIWKSQKKVCCQLLFEKIEITIRLVEGY